MKTNNSISYRVFNNKQPKFNKNFCLIYKSYEIIKDLIKFIDMIRLDIHNTIK